MQQLCCVICSGWILYNEYIFGELLGLSTQRMNELKEAGVFF